MNKNNNEKREYSITERELSVLDSIAYLEPFIIDIVDKAKPLKNGKYKIRIDGFDLKDILDAISYEATNEHIPKTKKKELVKLYGIIK